MDTINCVDQCTLHYKKNPFTSWGIKTPTSDLYPSASFNYATIHSFISS
jgi:hypothetical protein